MGLVRTELGGGDVELSDPTKLPTEPLVSVWMITYQHAAFIREALDSVLMQQVDFPYEICLGEDCSTDGTREICIEYVQKHPDKIRLFLRDRGNPARQKNNVYNTGETWNACRGKFIAMLEGDDYWTNPRKMHKQVELFKVQPTLTIIGHYAMSMWQGRPWKAAVIPAVPVSTFTLGDILRRDVGNVHTSTLMLRRGKAMDWKAFRESSFGDYPLIVWSLMEGHGAVLPSVMSMYRAHPGGVFGPLPNVVRVQQNVALWEIFRLIVPLGSQVDVEIGVATTRTWLVAELRKAGQLRQAIGCYFETLAMLARLPASASRRNGVLRMLALESLAMPRLRGLRRRLTQHLRVRHAGTDLVQFAAFGVTY